MQEKEEDYFEEEQEPSFRPVKGSLLSPFAAVVSVIIAAVALVATILSAIISFIIAVFRSSFDLPLAAKYSLSATDKCVTLFFTLLCEIWYRAFH